MTIAAEVSKRLLELHGETRVQPASNWKGAFPLPPAVEQLYREVGPFNVTIEGYGNPYFLPALAGLWQFQAGYRWNGLSGEPCKDWPGDWLVVADEGGDPFIFVRSSGAILYALHGTGKWEANEIFPDLNTMAACLAQIGAIVLEVAAGDDMDEDDDEDDTVYKLASVRLQKLLGIKSKVKTVLSLLGLG
jgi:hypothetical protein